jgi:hypothetical protein
MFPLILGFASEQALGTAVSVAAIGMVAGSLVMSAWKGPQRLVRGLILAAIPVGLGLAATGMRPSIPLVTLGALVAFSAIPFANSFSQALWQRKIEPDVQGRVFAVRRTLGQITGPLALVAAGPLLDHVFEPAMQPGGSLASSIGAVVGTGPGRGAALLIVVMGLMSVVISIAAYSYPRLRHIEDEIPDVVDLQQEPVAAGEAVPAAAPAG